jgi:hypothetical protein
MANIKASAADDGSGPVTSSCSFRLAVFESLPFVLKILARHFPGSYLNAQMSNPLYCMARPVCAFTAGRKGEPTLAAVNLTKTTRIPSARQL